MECDTKKIIKDIFTPFLPVDLELCAIDTMVRMEDESCVGCIFKVTEKIKYKGCPYKWVRNDDYLLK